MKRQVPVFMNEEIVVTVEAEAMEDENWGPVFTREQGQTLDQLRELFRGPRPLESEPVLALLASGTLSVVPRAEWQDDYETDADYLARMIPNSPWATARRAS